MALALGAHGIPVAPAELVVRSILNSANVPGVQAAVATLGLTGGEW